MCGENFFRTPNIQKYEVRTLAEEFALVKEIM